VSIAARPRCSRRKAWRSISSSRPIAAVVGDTEIAGLPYNVAGDDRLVLMPTSVLPEYRRQGIATELIRRVLDDVRTRERRSPSCARSRAPSSSTTPSTRTSSTLSTRGRPQGRTTPEPTRWAPLTEGVRQ
jgi:predicted GNAT family acetyltransferase